MRDNIVFKIITLIASCMDVYVVPLVVVQTNVLWC